MSGHAEACCYARGNPARARSRRSRHGHGDLSSARVRAARVAVATAIAELFRTVMMFHSKLEGAPALNMESVLRAEFANGAASLRCPAPNERSEVIAAADLVVIDEAARVEDELLDAVRPMLATSTGGGRLIALTTPAGNAVGFLMRGPAAMTGTGQRLRHPNARASRKNFLTRSCASLVQQRFSARSMGLNFLIPMKRCFPTAIIDAAFTESVLPLWNDDTVHIKHGAFAGFSYDASTRFVVGVDLGKVDRSDRNCVLEHYQRRYG